METRRLELLLELSRRGTMRAVADALNITTSTVSQQLEQLARDTGTALIEPAGRRVRLTPAGRRLAAHAVTILAAVDAARLDLDPSAEPAGTLRIAGFATAIRRSALPVMAALARDHPRVRAMIREHEPPEAYALLADDAIDLALTYDYDLAPARFDPGLTPRRLWSVAWALGVPATDPAAPGDAATVFRRYRDHDWMVNSRHTADEEVIRTVAAPAGFEPRIAHRSDSLDLFEDLIAAGLGVGLLPAGRPTRPGVRLLPLADPGIRLRAYAVVRRGRETWPPLALTLRLLRAA